jgi:putative hydrolase of the HAD superfamily
MPIVRSLEVEWIVFDYGGVLALAQSDAYLRGLAGIIGVSTAEFKATYWRHRDAYDEGRLAAGNYWEWVGADLGRIVSPDVVARLTQLDIESWLNLTKDVLLVAKDLEAAGYRLAILSNMPLEIAVAVRTISELGIFYPQIYSCDVGAIKPNETIYQEMLLRVGATPTRVVLVDDRPVNVDAARTLGIRGLHFTGAPSLARELHQILAS